jgi:hypothetical protein
MSPKDISSLRYEYEDRQDVLDLCDAYESLERQLAEARAELAELTTTMVVEAHRTVGVDWESVFP